MPNFRAEIDSVGTRTVKDRSSGVVVGAHLQCRVTLVALTETPNDLEQMLLAWVGKPMAVNLDLEQPDLPTGE